MQAGAYFQEKEYTPNTRAKGTEDSMDLNSDCSFSDYFDNHDMWHFLSGLSLLLFALVVSFIEHPDLDDPSATDQMVVF